ncbi:hypothetical protein ACWET9_40775 [Streptomyces sp. NPDC004059]
MTGCPDSVAPEAGFCVHTCHFDPTSTHRRAPVASFTVIDVPKSRASRAAFTLVLHSTVTVTAVQLWLRS